LVFFLGFNCNYARYGAPEAYGFTADDENFLRRDAFGEARLNAFARKIVGPVSWMVFS